MSKPYELAPWAVDAIESIAAQRAVISVAQSEVDRLVSQLREGFCPWTEIGAALGVSAQAAHHRYRG